jgi:hypothetical protein
VSVHEIERPIRKRERLPVGDDQVSLSSLQREILFGERDRRRRKIDAGDDGALRANRMRSVPAPQPTSSTRSHGIDRRAPVWAGDAAFRNDIARGPQRIPPSQADAS